MIAMVEWTFPSVVRGVIKAPGTQLLESSYHVREKYLYNDIFNCMCFNCACVQRWINFVEFCHPRKKQKLEHHKNYVYSITIN